MYQFRLIANEGVNPYDFNLPTEGTLEEAIELAGEHGIKVELFNEAGFRQGYVHPDGTWNLC